MKFKICFLLLITCHLIAFGQEFGLLRQNDDLSNLDSIANKNWYQKSKAITFSPTAVLSLGASWRFQAESFINDEFNHHVGQDDVWFLNRFLAHAHLKVGSDLSLFTELGSSLIAGKKNVSPVDHDELYVNQLFALYNITSKWNITAGRQNMRFGSGRLIDIREGPNVRRSFDFIGLNFKSDNFKAQTFFSVPVQPRPKAFDNIALNFDETFSGVYTTSNLSFNNYLDLYLLYQKDNSAIFNSGISNERRGSAGVRHFGKYKNLTYNNEMVFQFGRFGNQRILAWTLSFDIEKKVNLFRKDVTFGLKTEAISGDQDAADDKLNTFDALYPRGAYFGRVARFGPSNLIDIHPSINIAFKQWQVSLDYVSFWRYSLQDGLYGAAMTLDYPSLNNKRFIAHQIGTMIGYQPNKFFAFEFESNIIFPGSFLEFSNKGHTLYHFVLTSEIKF